MIRDATHWHKVLRGNPNASVGLTLAARMVCAALGSHTTATPTGLELFRKVHRQLKQEFGEQMIPDDVRAMMELYQSGKRLP